MDYMCMFWSSSYMQSAVVIGTTSLTVNEKFEGYTSLYLQVFQGKRLSYCATQLSVLGWSLDRPRNRALCVPWKWEEVEW